MDGTVIDTPGQGLGDMSSDAIFPAADHQSRALQ
jgi:hypothetical protein